MDRSSSPTKTPGDTSTQTSDGYRSVPSQGIDDQDVYETVYLQNEATESKPHFASDQEDVDAAPPLRIERERLKLSTILSDCAQIIVPIAFIIFASLVLSLDGSEVVELEFSRWKNAIAVLGTLFPILFASIVGRLIYEIAKWKLEQGATLGTLEQLMGSRTVGSTLVTQVQLRAIGPLSLGLLLIWIFSPLGAQAILRLLDSRFGSITQQSTVIHLDSDAPSMLSELRISTGELFSLNQNVLSYQGNFYSAMLLAPPATKADNMDLWGNVKIPFLSQKQSGKRDASHWSKVTWSSDPDSYSALAGYPVINISKGNSTFAMQSSYIRLNCSKQQKSWPDPAAHSESFERLNNITWPYPTSNWAEFIYENGSWYGVDIFNRSRSTSETTWSIATDSFVDKYWSNSSVLKERFNWTSEYHRPLIFENETEIESKPAHLIFEAQLPDGEPAREKTNPYVVRARCEVKQEYVESQIVCSKTDNSARQNCSVIAQRPSIRQHAPENISLLSFPPNMWHISTNLPLATRSMWYLHADLSIQHLVSSKHEGIIDNPRIEHFQNTTDTEFSRRLSQLLNTYLLLSQTNTQTSNGYVKVDGISFYNVSVPVRVDNQVQLYVVSKLWIVICFLSCIVLLIGGILSVVFTHLSAGPEILGYASTVIRDSKFLDLPPETGGMMAIKITKSMRNERLRYGLTDRSRGGQRLLGVGREEDTERIRNVSKRGAA